MASFATDRKIDLAKELEKATLAADSRLRVDEANYADAAMEMAVATTTGIRRHGRENGCYLSVSTLADDGDETQTGFGFTVGRSPADLDITKASRDAADRGLQVIIAGAGGAAHLPGMVASATVLPVIGVPVPLARLDGLDSLLSIVQMPAGVPVATVSIGGARNAGLLAVRMLGATDPTLRDRMAAFQADLADLVLRKDQALRDKLLGS